MTLEILTSPALDPIRHGFFTRAGGASSGVFAGLNCGVGSTDQAEAVAINRARVAIAMEAAPDALITIHQVHSADIVRAEDVSPAARPRADGMVTATPGLALAVLTADCQPVLFADPGTGVIGATHAGWRGALSGVLEATLDAMEDLGARRADIRAVIGPSISQPNYEVGPDFHDAFVRADSASSDFFGIGSGDRYQFDLPGYGLHRLNRAGVGHAEWTGHCTYADDRRFYSFRRSQHRKEADYGRLISAIRL